MQENRTNSALIDRMHDLTEYTERLVDGLRFCHSGRVITSKLYIIWVSLGRNVL